MINPLMKEFQPKEGDREGWQAFEEAYEEAIYLLRPHIIKPLNRKPEIMYGQRRVNRLIQKARVDESDAIFTK
jgi:hypothetical protein